LVFFPLFEPEGNFITQQAKEVKGFEHITLMGADAILLSTFIKDVGSAGEGMYFVGPATPSGAAYEAFVAKYKSKYGELPLGPFHAHGYDATNMLFEAITRIAVKEENGTLYIGRQALRDALQATSGFQGLTGTLSCDKFGDCAAASFIVVRLDDPAAGLEGLAKNVVYTYTPGQVAKRQ
jgi:branched-chain amino acid transport system substrate-binding protein